MVVDGAGARTEAGHWVKGAGGHKHGFQLLEELKGAGATTLPAILSYAAGKHGDAPCLGTRDVLGREHVIEDDRKMEKLDLGEYRFLTYREVEQKVERFATGLASLGPSQPGRIAMFAETRAEWFLAAMGCLRLRLALVTVYTNLGDDDIVGSLNETEVSLLVTSYDLLGRTLRILPRCPHIKHVVVMEDQLDGVGAKPDTLPEGVTMLGFQDVVKAGESSDPASTSELPSGSDLAIIMYTSGSTGRSKGVELTHDNIFHAIVGYTIQADLGLGDRYIAYLPLAHVMELATEIALLALNVTIAYSSPHTLTAMGTKVKKGCLGDAEMSRPTCMNAVPLILDRIIKGVTKKVESQGVFKARFFQEVLRLKQNTPAFCGKVLDAIVFNRIKAVLGGQLRMLVVGGAPLSPDTHAKFRALFGCTVQVGYGATETAASITSMDTDDPRTSHVGPPNYGVLIRLQDWEEGGYRTSDKPRPRGEILVGGPTVSRGYFRLPEETQAVFTEEDGVRWFQTGDVGEFDETGVLRIIDRKKDLIKLRTGEYVSLGTIEMKLKTNSSIESIFVYAFPGAERCVVVAVPNEAQLRKLAYPKEEVETPFASLCKDEKAVAAMLKDLQSHGKKQGLGRWDLPVALHLNPEPWTPESGLVSPALKNRRKALKDHFKADIDALYASVATEE